MHHCELLLNGDYIHCQYYVDNNRLVCVTMELL